MKKPEDAADVTYTEDLSGIDWAELKATLSADDFDNGRTPDQLRASFENSQAAVFAWTEGRVIGKARALSDRVCNAYGVDVWTRSSHRRRGIATEMMRRLMAKLPGQHLYLFTDDALEFYETLGFRRQGIGLARIIGDWLNHEL